VFKKAKKADLRGLRLRELEARDLTYMAPMAQIKSEILSQGFPSLQISRPPVTSSSWLEQPPSLFIGSTNDYEI
jgi:hypothetical protein